MERIRKVKKGMTPTDVGFSERNEKDSEKERLIGRNQGDTESKGIVASHEQFIISSRNH